MFTAYFYPALDFRRLEGYKFFAPQTGDNSGESHIAGSNDGADFFSSSYLIDTAFISWGDQYNDKKYVNVKVYATYVDTNNAQPTVDKSITVRIMRVWQPTITGARVIQNCCRNPLTYSASEYADANKFEWSISPSGGSVISGQGTNNITIIPPVQGSFKVICKASRVTGRSDYFRIGELQVNRIEPKIQKDLSSFKQKLLCPDSNYVFKIAPLCDATYSWIFPRGWNITSSNSNSNTINVFTTSTAASGNGIVSATFPGGCFASDTFSLDVLTAPPPTPKVPIPVDYDLGYHCGKWYFCPYGNIFCIDELPTAFNYTFEITAPWLVDGASSTTTNSTCVNISCPSNSTGGGTLKFRANNCIGSSGWQTLKFFRESAYFCKNPYPVWCECCLPLCPKCPPYMPRIGSNEAPSATENLIIGKNSDISSEDEIIKAPPTEITVFPNPSSGKLYLNCPVGIAGQIQLFDNLGRLISTKVFDDTGHDAETLSSESLSNGIYMVQIKTKNQIFNQKITVQHE